MVVEKPAAIVAVSEATKIKNKLRDMANQAGAKAYERLGLAQRLLADREWVATEYPQGNGSDGRATGGAHAALEAVEDEFFGDLCGAVPLARLLKMHEIVPEEDWKRHKYNLQRVYSAYLEKVQAEAPPRETPAPRPTREVVEKLQEEVKHSQAVAKHAEAEKKQAISEVEQLRRELEAKNAQIARLEGRVEELEKMIGRQRTLQSA